MSVVSITCDAELSARLVEVVSGEVSKTPLLQEGDKLVAICFKHGQNATCTVQRPTKGLTLSQLLSEWGRPPDQIASPRSWLGGSSSSESAFVWKVDALPFVPDAAFFDTPQSRWGLPIDSAPLVPDYISSTGLIEEWFGTPQSRWGLPSGAAPVVPDYIDTHLIEEPQLAHRLLAWLQINANVMRVPDKRASRLAKELMVWTKAPNAQSEIELPTDLFTEMLDNAVMLSEDNPNGRIRYSAGAVAMQKVLVISSPRRKIQVIQLLRSSARRLVHHHAGCFVASQIVQEGLVCSENIDTSRPDHIRSEEYMGVAMAAVEFMEIALAFADARLFDSNLVNSIKHRHANHSLKLFVLLLASLESAHNHAPSTSHLEAILAPVVHNAFGLA